MQLDKLLQILIIPSENETSDSKLLQISIRQ